MLSTVIGVCGTRPQTPCPPPSDCMKPHRDVMFASEEADSGELSNGTYERLGSENREVHWLVEAVRPVARSVFVTDAALQEFPLIGVEAIRPMLTLVGCSSVSVLVKRFAKTGIESVPGG